MNTWSSSQGTGPRATSTARAPSSSDVFQMEIGNLDEFKKTNLFRMGLIISTSVACLLTIITGLTLFIIGTTTDYERYYVLSVIGPAILGVGILLGAILVPCYLHQKKRELMEGMGEMNRVWQMAQKREAQHRKKDEHKRAASRQNQSFEGDLDQHHQQQQYQQQQHMQYEQQHMQYEQQHMQYEQQPQHMQHQQQEYPQKDEHFGHFI